LTYISNRANRLKIKQTHYVIMDFRSDYRLKDRHNLKVLYRKLPPPQH
jgi:hypothetical protein